MRRFQLLGAGLLLASLLGGAQLASASQTPVLTDAGTYGYAYPNCPQVATTNTLTVSNIASTETLSGWIQTEQVVPISNTYPDGRRIIQKYNVSWSGPSDFSQVVTWPAFNDPTVVANTLASGTIEYHLDIAIDVYDGSNFVVTLGPGQDYDGFCIGNPPPPPPPPSNFGTRTLGYWKTHTTLWPSNAVIQLGGISYNTSNVADKAYLISILKNANAKDVTYMLAAQLITSELNYASGSPHNADASIQQANAYLTANPIGSNPQKGLKDQGSSLTDSLDKFNQSLDFG